MREEKSAGEASLTEIQSKVEKHYPTDWLLTMEIYELAEKNNFKDVSQKSFSRLIALQDSKVSLNSETKSLIERGFKVLMT
jgi:FtsZ-binding cell division protein ZapB